MHFVNGKKGNAKDLNANETMGLATFAEYFEFMCESARLINLLIGLSAGIKYTPFLIIAFQFWPFIFHRLIADGKRKTIKSTKSRTKLTFLFAINLSFYWQSAFWQTTWYKRIAWNCIFGQFVCGNHFAIFYFLFIILSDK